DVGASSDAIFVTLDTKNRNTFRSLISARDLQIFTDGGEFLISQKPVTPEYISVTLQSQYGSTRTDPVNIDGTTLFLEKNTGALREFVFTFQEDAYTSPNLSILAQNVISDPVDMAAFRGTLDEDANYVIILNSDGTAAVYNTLRSQEISNFTRYETNGVAVAVEAVESILYFTVQRDVNGTAENLLEIFNTEHYTDSSILQDLGAPSLVVTGLDHLDGKECRVRADGSVQNNKTPVNGQITLDSEAQVVEVGLDYDWQIQLMPLSLDYGAGQTSMHRKSIAKFRLQVYETLGLNVDGRDIPVRGFGLGPDDTPLDNAPVPFTGVIDDIEGQTGWEITQEPTFSVDDPVPVTILAIETTVRVN
ncbi:MAG: hypothetical protein KAJ19_08525, partial [Gammaproteobacteria bacterium]|nr:hypothetical protein [Gammaproteobacteria bacterium]